MKVGVVGLGLSGLRTAMLLERAGIETVLFEARPRAGGRVWTIEDSDGPLYEAGGEWIDGDHVRMLSLLDELGIAPRSAPEGSGVVIHRGERTTDDALWDEALEAESVVEDKACAMCQELQSPAWQNSWAADLDRRPLDHFLRDTVDSERGHFWVTAKYRADEGEDLDHVGLLGWLAGFTLYTGRDGSEAESWRIPGGAGEVCTRMLSRIECPAAFDRVLKAVRQDATGVSLVFGDGEVRVDRAVLTLPPSCLRRVAFEPALPPEKSAAVEACRMGRTIKICWEFDRAWWRDLAMNGNLAWDGPLQCVWDASIGETPVLCAYICGQDAVRFDTESDPVRTGLHLLAGLFPAAAKCFVRGQCHSWTSDPYSRGGFSHMQPRYVLDHLRYIAPPAGRLHFAGEHTAAWTGFMEGALESAERVSEEVLALA